MVDILYKNHPTLDPIYKKVFEKFPDLMQYTMQLEVCDRLGKVTLAIWLDKMQQPENIASYILFLFRDILTAEQIEVYNKLVQRDQNSVLLLVNPDKYDNILRYYYQYDLDVYGHDIQPDGEISKSKSYFVSLKDNKVKTVHKYSDGNKKITYAEINKNVSELPSNCYMTLTRDDGHIYYMYQPVEAMK